MSAARRPPLLVLGWGNPSRGDDALGPLFLERLGAGLSTAQRPQVECLEDFQLQIEHALDLRGRQQLLFVDASLDSAPPFTVRPVLAQRDRSISSHALSPEALLQVYEDLEGCPAPEALLLAIRGQEFGLGQPLGAAAESHLQAALAWARGWLTQLDLDGQRALTGPSKAAEPWPDANAADAAAPRPAGP